MEIVKGMRSDIEYNKVRGSYIETMDQKIKSHLYLDQFVGSTYGRATIEALAFGVPVVTWLDEYKYYDRDCPIQTPWKLTPELLAQKIMMLCDWDRLEALSKTSFEWVKKTHGQIGQRWIDIFKELKN
jgi:hypothetical protein